MILNIIILYDKVGCLLDILGQEKCFQCLQKEKSAQSLNRASAQRSLLGREGKDEHTTFPLFPAWLDLQCECLYHLCARSEDIQFVGVGLLGHHIHPSQGLRHSLLHINHQKFCRPSLNFLAKNWTSKRQSYGIRWCLIRSPEGCPINLAEVKIFSLNAKLLLLSGVVS